ncbi:MAG: insulinase family protein [Bryobacteraceae bacterium]|nr:insulinase family protein [Bryobacteraceae bacterium]
MRFPAAPSLCFLLAAGMHAAEPTSFSLDNGMKVIVEEDHDIPNVAMYLFYRIGSRNERPGITGISHFFEHMMFNGAAKFGPKQFDIQMERAGGRNNAYTSTDLTVYQDWFPRTALKLMFDMEADRIRNLSLDPKIVESERGVVASERQTSVDNSNYGLLSEQLSAAAYTAHPYGWPVVGWASDIRAWTIDDLKEHFRVGYAPNNCTLVIVGDVTVSEVKALATEFLQPIPRQEPPQQVRTVEPEQRGERRVSIVKAAQLPLVLIGYHVGNSTHPDMVPLEVLGAVLSDGQSSRLYRRLVDKDQLALSASQFLRQRMDPGQIVFSLSPRAGVDPADAEKALYEEIEKLRATEVPADELRKAKNLLLTELYRERKTISGRANLLGSYDIFKGDFRKLYTAGESIEAVTASDLMRVAKQYLVARNRTVATLVPEKRETTSAIAPGAGKVEAVR